MSPGYWIDRNFLVKFVEELQGRGIEPHVGLSSLPTEQLRVFAIFAEVSDELIIRFVQSNNCVRLRARELADGCGRPPISLVADEMRNSLVLALLEKANLGNAKRDITAFNPTRRWQEHREFISNFLSETRKGKMNVLEFLFSDSSENLERFALLIGLPQPLINRFVESADPMERPEGDLVHCPPCKRLRDRRDLVLAIVEKVGR